MISLSSFADLNQEILETQSQIRTLKTHLKNKQWVKKSIQTWVAQNAQNYPKGTTVTAIFDENGNFETDGSPGTVKANSSSNIHVTFKVPISVSTKRDGFDECECGGFIVIVEETYKRDGAGDYIRRLTKCSDCHTEFSC